MKLVVGLGNPGDEYKNTRHNVGFTVVDALASRQFSIFNFQFSKKFNADILQTDDILLAKPMTFMNRSGEAVKKIMTNYKLQMPNLYIIHDDLDIPLGSYKIQLGKGPKEHRGILSIEQSLGRKDFWRVRIGVENRSKDISGDEYVLSNFSGDEKKIIDRIMEEVVNKLWVVLNQ